MPDPRSVEDHQQRILDEVSPLPGFPQPLLDSMGLATAEAVTAPVDLPGFDNSAMDGYAVAHADVAAADADTPVELPVIGEIGAGRGGLEVLSPGTAAKIMTGAPIPVGCDAVVPYEWTDRGVARVRIDTAPSLGQHIRRAGEDIAAGSRLLAPGVVLGPRQLGLLAAVGHSTVVARPRPRVVVISTGSELRAPGTRLGRDSLYDGNSYLLAAAAQAAGAVAYRVGAVPDDPGALLATLDDQLVRADVVVTSGGISEGDYDVVKEALGGRLWFGPVAMQPGKPQGFGVVGDDRVPLITLPGNPVSAYISFEVFVRPLLRRMMGLEPVFRPTVSARLAARLTSPAGKRQFARARWEETADGPLVHPMGRHGSHLLGDLAAADTLLVVPEDTTTLDEGDTVAALRLDLPF